MSFVEVESSDAVVYISPLSEPTRPPSQAVVYPQLSAAAWIATQLGTAFLPDAIKNNRALIMANSPAQLRIKG